MKLTRHLSRRNLLGAVPAAAALLTSAARGVSAEVTSEKPGLLGGKPLRTQPFPSWPVTGQEDEHAVVDVVRSGQWYRGEPDQPSAVKRFESAYAQLTGARHCLAVSSGTGALQTSLGALGVGPGDEVILPPYTFVATLNVILMQHALPIFVDTDPETAQINAAKIESAITARTAAMIAVHMGGSPANLDAILPIAQKHHVPLIEDAAQAHLAEWRGRKVGTYGATGCFSFQASKNLNCGEGGAILTNDEELYEKCYAFHYNGQGRKGRTGDFTDSMYGTKYCMTGFQAAIALAQMTRLEQQSRTRDQNAQYLTSLLREIPGILPQRQYPGATRSAYHGYMFRYKKEQFAGLPKGKFLRALEAEGIHAGGGYSPLNKRKYLKNALQSKGYQRIYSSAELAAWEERNRCPANDQFCSEAVWFYQTMFLAGRSDMEQVAEAIRKVHSHAGALAKA